MAAICCGWMSAANAAPSCGAIVATPADGIIPAGAVIANSQTDACFDNASTPIVNNGAVTNSVSAGLTSQGALTVNAGASLWNYGKFHNYAGASLTSHGSLRNYQGGTFTNSGTLLTSDNGANRNYGLWINSDDATMDVRTTFDNYSGATFINNGVAALAESLNASGASFENNGFLIDRTAGMSYILNQGTFTNNVNGNSTIHLLANENILINKGRLEVADSKHLRNKGTLNNESTGKLFISGIARNQAGGVIDNAGLMQTNVGGKLENSGRIENRLGASLFNAGRLENKAGGVLTSAGTFANNGTIVNEGTVHIESTTAVGAIGSYVQNSGKTTIDGSIQQRVFSVFGGELAGSGYIDASVLVQGGEIAADGLTIAGNLDFYGGTISNTIGASDFTVLNVLGTAYISSATFKFDFGSYIPDVGDSWIFLTGNVTGYQDNFLLDIQQAGNILFELDIVADGLRLTAVADQSTVPVPAAAWLFGSGLLGLFGAGRIRSRVA
jgi:hypothetical protein